MAGEVPAQEGGAMRGRYPTYATYTRRAVVGGLVGGLVALPWSPATRSARAARATPVASPAAGRAGSRRYEVVDLGVLPGGDLSTATSLNAAGVAAGSSVTSATSVTRAVVFGLDGGPPTALRAPGLLGSSSANAINAAGDCAGYSEGVEVPFRATRWVGGVPEVLPTLGGGQAMAFGIDDAGTVVGWAQPGPPGIEPRACRWEGGGSSGSAPAAPVAPVDLGTLGTGIRSVAYGIDGEGDVVGASTVEPDEGTRPAAEHAVLWLRDETVDLGTVAGSYSAAVAVNRDRVVVGVSTTGRGQRPFGPGTQATLWAPGEPPVALGTLGTGERSQATAVDAAGVVVGSSATTEELPAGQVGQEHACLWEPGATTPFDLNDALPPGSGWVLERANGINGAGQIAGVGYLDGKPRAFRLDPR